MNLRKIIEAKGYTVSDLVLRWPPSRPVKEHSRRRWVNLVLSSDRQEHIDMVNGLPDKQ
jgi:hypothetical protein